jgi:hypothetical protein
MDQEKQGPSALVRDITEPGWREKEAERDRAIAQVMQKVPLIRADESWNTLPQRLRWRGDFLITSGQIKDAELLYDAATEIEGLRARVA